MLMDQEEDADQRRFLCRVLADGAERLGVELSGEPLFSWCDRTVGSRAQGDSGPVWIRATAEHHTWTQGLMWTGNSDAAVLTDVAKPTVLARVEWDEPPVGLYAEVMTLAASPACSPTPVLRCDLDLDEEWWTRLADSLARLAAYETKRIAYRRSNFERHLRVRFGRRLESVTPVEWAVAHTDLHWANVTCPELSILDWEGWGWAPAGIDAAQLYCHSLLQPSIAAKVHQVFADVLDTPTGKLSQLSVIDHLLDRAAGGENPDLVLPLHDHADRLLSQ